MEVADGIYIRDVYTVCVWLWAVGIVLLYIEDKEKHLMPVYPLKC